MFSFISSAKSRIKKDSNLQKKLELLNLVKNLSESFNQFSKNAEALEISKEFKVKDVTEINSTKEQYSIQITNRFKSVIEFKPQPWHGYLLQYDKDDRKFTVRFTEYKHNNENLVKKFLKSSETEKSKYVEKNGYAFGGWQHETEMKQFKRIHDLEKYIQKTLGNIFTLDELQLLEQLGPQPSN